MAQQTGSSNVPLLLMAGNTVQTPSVPTQQCVPQMVSGQPQSCVNLIPFGSQPYPQYQLVAGGQMPQFQTYILQPTGTTPVAERAQFVVPQSMPYFQQPQFIIAPGQQTIPTSQQQTFVTGGQQIMAMNTATPAFMSSNHIQYVPASALHSNQRQLSPNASGVSKALWNTQTSGQLGVSLSPRYVDVKAGQQSGLLSPRPSGQSTMLASPKSPSRIPFQELEIRPNEHTTKPKPMQETSATMREPEGISKMTEKLNKSDKMVPISLKNKYEHIKYNPELEPKYFGDCFNVSGLVRGDDEYSQDRKRRLRLQEYLRDRPIKTRQAPPTPMFAVYQLREKNWDKKIRKKSEKIGKVNKSGRGFRNLSDLLGSMNSDTFTRMDDAEFRNSHHHAWSKSHPRMPSDSDSDDEYKDDDIDDDVFDQDDANTRQPRLQSFGFATPNRQGVATTTPEVSPTEQDSHISPVSSECLKDSAFSDDSTPDELDSEGHRSADNLATNVGKNPTVDTIPKMKRSKSGKNVLELIAQEFENERRATKRTEQEARQDLKVTKGNPNQNKRGLKSPSRLGGMSKRAKITSPRFTRKGPLRRPTKRQPSGLKSEGEDWLARASVLASSAFKDRSANGRRRLKSRNA
ncbi:uncharacterized protein LOC102808505 [Saccoglossus kowalevskii]|uniref:Uncharacterized protein LOC102808505 n=1 Tax=Saccoglossus kowalevskii TaxID=10224 RepID=A0ABM0MNH8_SACKO|nr:PREDICTED: uncharacterized protein LOC102808505 [Saccoglossus kowalevskii]